MYVSVCNTKLMLGVMKIYVRHSAKISWSKIVDNFLL